MTYYERMSLQLARECLVFIVHGYASHVCADMMDKATVAGGLCSTLANWIEHRNHSALVAYDSDVVTTWMVEWNESTKWRGYPVPAPHSAYTDPVFDDQRESFAAFHFYDDSCNKYEGEYGELRLDLARFLITKIDEELNK